MYLLKEKFFKLVGRCVLVLAVCLSGQLLHAAPVLLSNAELDRISGGYVELEVNALAIAKGPNSVARFSANVEQVIGEAQEDNYIYTTTTGLAEAFAKGRKVYTEVGYFFQTDEEILSFDVVHKSSSRTGRGKSGKNRKKNNKKGKKHTGKNKGKNKSKNNKKKKHTRKVKGNKKKGKKRSGRKNVKRERQQLYVTVVTRRPVE